MLQKKWRKEDNSQDKEEKIELDEKLVWKTWRKTEHENKHLCINSPIIRQEKKIQKLEEMKIISEDEAYLAVRLLDCSVSMEGGPSGAVPPKHFSKPPSVTVWEGAPPIGKERGALKNSRS